MRTWTWSSVDEVLREHAVDLRRGLPTATECGVPSGRSGGGICAAAGHTHDATPASARTQAGASAPVPAVIAASMRCAIALPVKPTSACSSAGLPCVT
jgi:hypothetical protein